LKDCSTESSILTCFSQKLNWIEYLLPISILRTINAFNYAGIRAILVHAKDEKARTFSLKFDFDLSPIDPLQLMFLLKDAKKAAEDIKS
jgi:hypothetical protein